MLEIQVNDNEFKKIKNSFIYIYSDSFLSLHIIEIIEEWRKLKEEYFICFSNSNNKNESIYCKPLNISISIPINELKYLLTVEPTYILDKNSYERKINEKM